MSAECSPERRVPERCRYFRWQQLPAGADLDLVMSDFLGRSARWSTDPRLVPALLRHLMERPTDSLSLHKEPDKARWTVEHWGGRSDDPYGQEGEGETLNLALCRATLDIECDVCGHRPGYV